VVSWAIQRGTLVVIPSLGAFPQTLSGFLGLWASIVVGQLQPCLSSIFALAIETVPGITLASTGYNDFGQADPSFANEFRLFIVVEDGHLEVVVVG
jgi:hypothetical protein